MPAPLDGSLDKEFNECSRVIGWPHGAFSPSLQDMGNGFNEMGCDRGTRVATRCTGCVGEGRKFGGRTLQKISYALG